MKELYRTNPAYRQKHFEQNKKWRENNPEKFKESARRAAKKLYDKRPKGFKTPTEAWILAKDFEAYLERLKKNKHRHKSSPRKMSLAAFKGIERAKQEDEQRLKQFFVESVDKVIDGGMELKVAKKLGIDYKVKE